MKQEKTEWGWALLALPLWPVLSFLDANKGEHGVDPVWLVQTVGGVWLGFIAFFLILGLWLKKKRNNARTVRLAGTAACLLTLACFYHDIKSLLPWPEEETTKPLLIWFGLAILSAWAIWAASRKQTIRAAAGIFSLVVVISAFFQLAQDSEGLWAHFRPSFWSERATDSPVISVEEITKTNKPNAYIFIFDAYLRPDWLAKAYDFDDAPFVLDLREKGFFVAEKSLSQFSTTKYSIGLLLDPHLFEEKPEKIVSELRRRNVFLGDEAGSAQKNLQAIGYDFAMLPHTGKEGAGCAPNCITTKPSTSLMEAQFYKTLPVYDILKRFFPGIIWGWFSGIPNDAAYALDHLPAGLKAPYAVFIHLLFPHPPYARNADCSFRATADFAYEKEDSSALDRDAIRGLYLNQIRCANKQMLAVADRLKAADPSALIVFASDHGWKSLLADRERSYKKTMQKLMRFSNFWAARFPQKCAGLLKDPVFFVNTFPLIQSCLTGEPSVLYPFRAYALGKDRPFLDVTDELDGQIKGKEK